MNHRKWVHNFFFYTLVSLGFVLIALIATSDAHATERTTDTLTRVVETCSDCYGQKSK